MLATATKNQIFLARVVVVLIIAFLVAGASTYGFSAEVRARFWHDLLERPDQFMRFRFILQPIMAAIAALHDGIEDARLGRSPYIWTLLRSPSKRVGRLEEGAISTARVLLLGLCMDILDGYNIIPYVTGEVKESPRNHIIYFSDDGEVMAVRVGDYKFNLAVQRATRMMQWAEPMVKLRLPLIFHLRRDPFERADFNSNTYFDWMVDHVPQLYLMQATVAAEIENFVKFPPRQKPASFNLDAVLAMVSTHGAQS